MSSELSKNAEILLGNPAYKEAITEVRQYWLSRVETLPLDAEKGEGALYDIRRMLFLLRQVEETIERYVEDGKLEDHNEAQPSFLGDMKWLRR